MNESLKTIIEKGLLWFVPVSLLVVLWNIYIYAGGRLSFWHGDALRGFGAWTLGILLVGVVIRVLFRQRASAGLFAFLLLFLFISAGPITSIAAMGFLFSLITIGKLFFIYFGKSAVTARFYELALVGLSVYLVIFGVMIHYPVNYSLFYVLILALPLLAFCNYGFRQIISSRVNLFKNQLREGLCELKYWHFLAFVWLVGYVGSYSFLPVAMSDDNNYHLGMWTQLTYHQQYLFDVKSLIWAVSPFAVDLIHSIVSLVAGANARASINLVFYGLLLVGLWALCSRLTLGSSQRLMVVALFASTPMLANLLQSLQTDLFMALLAVVGALVLFDKEREQLYRLSSIFLLGCLLCATKLPALVLAGAFFIALLLTLRRADYSRQWGGLSVFGMILLVTAGAFVAFHSYVSAYVITQNPVFPLYNTVFQSPFYNLENFKDPIYTKGVSWLAYWGLFFDSQTYFESPADFVAGFQYLFLLPFALMLMLLNADDRRWAILAIPLVLYAGIMFYMMQYLRYLFAILPLAAVLIAYFYMGRTKSYGLSAVLCAHVFLNLWFLPGVSWNFYLNNMKFLTSHSKQEAMAQLNPEILMNNYVNRTYGKKNVLYDVSRSNGATLAGSPFYLSWCAPLHLASANKWRSEKDVLNFLRENKIELIYWFKPYAQNDNYFRADIRMIIEKYGVLEKEIGGLELYRVDFSRVHFN
ncbi:MAG: hypothetical protein Q7T48_20920 [Cellvibrio sp.]|uniref:hypothetical protein n=1 Tax=Cellvibrio sp. TaxID=1965322 RepID=UPI002716AAC1|nr:hypothetical protein [Cellvibrio sp.]